MDEIKHLQERLTKIEQEFKEIKEKINKNEHYLDYIDETMDSYDAYIKQSSVLDQTMVIKMADLEENIMTLDAAMHIVSQLFYVVQTAMMKELLKNRSIKTESFGRTLEEINKKILEENLANKNYKEILEAFRKINEEMVKSDSKTKKKPKSNVIKLFKDEDEDKEGDEE